MIECMQCLASSGNRQLQHVGRWYSDRVLPAGGRGQVGTKHHHDHHQILDTRVTGLPMLVGLKRSSKTANASEA